KYLLVTGMLCFMFLGCATEGVTPPPNELQKGDDERRLWQRAEAEQRVLNESGLVYEDVELEAYLNRVARNLQPYVLENIPFRIFVLKDPHLNAFSFPNGAIYVHTGILARMNNEAQLATLLAHEMTHCTRRHALRAFRKIKNIRPSCTTTESSLVESPGNGDLLTLLGSTGSLAAVSGYTRELETEADMVGLGLIVNAGYDPKEGIKLFEHLRSEIEICGIREPFFFGTHPKLQKRIENCRKFLESQDLEKVTGIKNTRIFLTSIQGVILENAFLDLRAGRFYAAQKGLEKYLTLKPGDARAYYLFGEVCRQRAEEGDLQKAKALFEKAIFVDPSYPEPHKAIGLIYYKAGQKRLARVFFETCLALSPKLPDRAYVRGYLEKCKE
ncbi:MAG: M48 family metalloprotease, partial [Desulfobacteraceae bacterium]